jgi:hypothetical protein
MSRCNSKPPVSVKGRPTAPRTRTGGQALAAQPLGDGVIAQRRSPTVDMNEELSGTHTPALQDVVASDFAPTIAYIFAIERDGESRGFG